MMYDLPLINSIKDILIENSETLAIAESTTGGHLQALFSTATDASGFFQGGITVYNIGQKCRHLNVEPVHAQNNNCVTAKVARRMAIEVNRLFLSDYGIAITGYASRIPQQGIHELFAFYAIAAGDEVIRSEKIFSTQHEGTDTQQGLLPAGNPHAQRDPAGKTTKKRNALICTGYMQQAARK